jgi:endonuclease-8
MPEGHTIFRTARTLNEWITGRRVTKATSVRDLPVHKLVGRTVTEIEPRGKHLLIRFDSGLTLHTHMKMTGSWHVYRTGDAWRKPANQARVVLEVDGGRVAVCFNAPVVELLAAGGEQQHRALVELGPDILAEPVDLATVRQRARELAPPAVTIGELLLDQRIVSGIGNIFRCEALFVRRTDPFARWTSLADDDLDALVLAAAELMQRAVRPGPRAQPVGRGGPDDPWVFGRARRPCHRCRTPIQKRVLGSPLPRDVYWCPRCQPAPPVAPGTA